VALANARRFDVEHSTASLLTSALHPGELPKVPGFEVASRYIPAEGRVAGDWFDAFDLPWGSFLVGIGDVGGHGIPAASLMAQLGNAARGLALSGGRVGSVIKGLAELTLRDDAHRFETALYGLLAPAEGGFLWSSAGHIPPLAFGPALSRWLSFVTHPPFGTGVWAEPPESYHQLDPEEGLILLTDGVVERRGSDIAAGLDQLRKFVTEHAGLSADLLADGIVAEFCGTPRDDCCILPLRRSALGPTS
jgi:serine phosphatase RsbU (regulator of sigma subunit)